MNDLVRYLRLWPNIPSDLPVRTIEDVMAEAANYIEASATRENEAQAWRLLIAESHRVEGVLDRQNTASAAEER